MNSSQFSMSRSEVEFFTPSPITYLLFSLSLDTSGEKSLSPEATTKQVMCSFWKRHVHGVHDQPYVRGVLAAHGLLRHLDELDGGLVEGSLVVGVAAPVGVGLLDEELALVQQALQDEVHVELAVVGVANADGDVLEVDEQGETLLVLLSVLCQTSSSRGVLATPGRAPAEVPGGGRPGYAPGPRGSSD